MYVYEDVFACLSNRVFKGRFGASVPVMNHV